MQVLGDLFARYTFPKELPLVKLEMHRESQNITDEKIKEKDTNKNKT